MLLKLINRIETSLSESQVIQSIEYSLSNEFMNLDVKWDIKIKDQRILIEINGEDSEICASFIAKEYGVVIEKSKIRFDYEYLCYIKSIDDDKIILECGFLLKMNKNCFQYLGIGSITQICSRFGLIEGIPLLVKIDQNFEATLSKNQIDYLWTLKKSENDYLVINNCTKSTLKDILRKTKHQRDIYKTKRLGLLGHLIFCKKNTDGPGLVASIGPFLKSKIGVIIGTKKKLVLK